MSFSNNQKLAAADLNTLASTGTANTFTSTQQFNGAGNPKVNTAMDLTEQSSTPATPAASTGRLYIDNGNPPLVKLVQDDGDVHVVGGYQYDETRRGWVLYDRDLTTWVRHWDEVELVDEWFPVNTDATNNFIYTNSGVWGVVETGATTFTDTATRTGRVRVVTAGAINDRCALLPCESTTNAATFRTTDQVQFMVALLIPQTATTLIQLGIASDPSASANPGADGIYWEYDSAASANWIGVVRTGAANTDTDSSVAAGTSNIHLLFIVNGGVDVKFYTRTAYTSAWTLAGTNAGAQPSSATNLIPFIRIEALAAAPKTLDILRSEIRGYRTDA